MNTKMNKKDVQLLLKNKEIRKALLEDLLYFQKKAYQEDNHLDKLIKRLEKENIRDSPIEYDRIKDEINELENKLLSRYPDIKKEYERKVIFKQKKQKNKEKHLQISKYTKKLLENMSYTQNELQRKAGFEIKSVKEPFKPQEKQIEEKNELFSNDNNDFLQQLEDLTKPKKIKELEITVNDYIDLLPILQTINRQFIEKNLIKTINSIENGTLRIKDPILSNSYKKALELLED